MWDNRASKRNPRAPDFKCKDRQCDGVIWPSKEAVAAALAAMPQPEPTSAETLVPVPGAAGTADDPACPVCGGKMWDDRKMKRNPRAPDFKCRNKPKFKDGPGCPGVIWPPREGERSSAPVRQSAASSRAPGVSDRARPRDSEPPPSAPPGYWDSLEPTGDDDLPF